MDSSWDKVHQPCPLCGSSDAVGVNKDGSAKCFSCGEFMPKYDKQNNEGSNMQKQNTNTFKQTESLDDGLF